MKQDHSYVYKYHTLFREMSSKMVLIRKNSKKVSISIIFRYLIHRLKGKFYEHKFTETKRGLRIKGIGLKIRCHGKIIVGENLTLRSITHPIEISAEDNVQVIIGDNVFINTGVIIAAKKRICIGNETTIGD